MLEEVEGSEVWRLAPRRVRVEAMVAEAEVEAARFGAAVRARVAVAAVTEPAGCREALHVQGQAVSGSSVGDRVQGNPLATM